MNISTNKLDYSWSLCLILFLLISPMFFGPYIAFVNPEFFQGVGNVELNLALTLYVARNLAVGIAFFLAIYLRNASMLFILIIVRLITDLIDFSAFQIFRNPPLLNQIIIFTLICYLPAFFGLRVLWREMKNSS